MKDIGMSWYRHWDGLTGRGGRAVAEWTWTKEDGLARRKIGWQRDRLPGRQANGLPGKSMG